MRGPATGYSLQPLRDYTSYGDIERESERKAGKQSKYLYIAVCRTHTMTRVAENRNKYRLVRTLFASISESS